MAKTKACQFCGKEITTGFFKGTERLLDIGSGNYISCCEDCYNKYQEDANRVKERLGTKLENYNFSSDKVLGEGEKVRAFLHYLEEEKEYAAKEGYTPDSLGFFVLNDKGEFTASEYELNFSGSKKQFEKDLLHRLNSPNAWFNKDHIAKLEFCYAGNYYASTEFGQDVYAFQIRLNDEKEITYKPCVLRFAIATKGFTGGIRKQKAKEKCVEMLNELKNAIGSDLPVVEVKKFD